MSSLLIGGQLFGFSIKALAGAFILGRWIKYQRESLLLWSLFFLSSALSNASEVLKFSIGAPLFYALSIAFLSGGVVALLDEEAVGFPVISLKTTALILPLSVSMYILAYSGVYSKIAGTSNPMHLAFGVAGIFYVFSGLMFWRIRKFYANTGTILGVTLIIHGLHVMDYPFLRPVEWFAPIGFSIGALLTLVEAVAFVRIVVSERFKYAIPEEKPLVIRKGVFLLSPKEFESYVTALSKFPVLAFTRRRNLPDGWEIHNLTTLEGPGKIGPTQLHRIIERTRSYLAEAHREGATGVVIIEGLEYLLMYNDFRSVLKFLATLSDYVALYGGMLVLVFDEKSLEERQLKTLRQVLNAGGTK